MKGTNFAVTLARATVVFSSLLFISGDINVVRPEYNPSKYRHRRYWRFLRSA
jgi:hypothetical protein